MSACNTNIQISQAKKNYKKPKRGRKQKGIMQEAENQFASGNLRGASRGGVNKPYKMILCSSNRNPRSMA
jgi:hypothetical protein